MQNTLSAPMRPSNCVYNALCVTRNPFIAPLRLSHCMYNSVSHTTHRVHPCVQTTTYTMLRHTQAMVRTHTSKPQRVQYPLCQTQSTTCSHASKQMRAQICVTNNPLRATTAHTTHCLHPFVQATGPLRVHFLGHT